MVASPLRRPMFRLWHRLGELQNWLISCFYKFCLSCKGCISMFLIHSRALAVCICALWTLSCNIAAITSHVSSLKVFPDLFVQFYGLKTEPKHTASKVRVKAVVAQLPNKHWLWTTAHFHFILTVFPTVGRKGKTCVTDLANMLLMFAK